MIIQILILTLLAAILAETSYVAVKLARQNRPAGSSHSIIVDTSVLIDGRILMIAEAGFIGGKLVVPRSVIGELQYLADNADHEKRARARSGLDLVKKLQDSKTVEVEILQDGIRPEEGVDERLLNLAKKYGASILTIDFNLNKVAAVEKVQVLNINELAQKLRMSYLPGEKMTIDIVQQGQDNHQGVGYLADGTMVVVEQASKLVGKTAEIEFIRALQTAAGKMMFAKLVEQPKANHSKSSRLKSKPRSFKKQPKSAEDRLLGLVDKQ